MPIAELSEGLKWSLVGGALALLYVFAWVAVSPMPRIARLLARLFLTALALVPVLLLFFNSDFGAPRAPTGSPPPYQTEAPNGVDSADPAKPKPPSKKNGKPLDDEAKEVPTAPAPTVPAPQPAPPSPEPTPPPPPASESPGPAAPAPTPAPEPAQPDSSSGSSPDSSPDSGPDSGMAPRSSDDGASAPPPATTPGPTGGSGPPTDAPAAGGEAPPPPPPVTPAPTATEPGRGAEESKDWDVVPVYYGTDRSRADGDKRIDYGAERGKRLELGQALVTVPKAHEVPDIERPWAIRIPYFDVTLYEEAEDPNKHFTMKDLKSLTRDEFLSVVKARLAASTNYKDHALVFIHGYNTSFDNAAYRTAQVAYDLKFDGAPFLYSWPSGGSVASYTYDRESVEQARSYLHEFLDLVVKDSGAKSVSIIAHSMGNQLMLDVLRDMRPNTAPGGVVVSQVILAAPDVDRDAFEGLARDIQGLANGVTLYAAANDRALNASRRFHGGVPRAGDVPEGGPVVVPGIDTIDITSASTDALALNHSSYAQNNALLEDIQLLVQSGERPPEKRSPKLQKIETAKGVYWKYPGAN